MDGFSTSCFRAARADPGTRGRAAPQVIAGESRGGIYHEEGADNRGVGRGRHRVKDNRHRCFVLVFEDEEKRHAVTPKKSVWTSVLILNGTKTSYLASRFFLEILPESSSDQTQTAQRCGLCHLRKNTKVSQPPLFLAPVLQRPLQPHLCTLRIIAPDYDGSGPFTQNAG
jgi:hypothetical protein